MIHWSFSGAYFAHGLPGGSYVVQYTGSHFETHEGYVPFPAGETYGFATGVVCTNVVPFRFAGLLHNLGRVYECTPSWTVINGETVWTGLWERRDSVTTPVYDQQGRLIDKPVMLPDGQVSSHGWRFVNDANIAVSEQDSYGPTDGVFQWSEHRGLKVGQGPDEGVKTSIGGWLDVGNTNAIHFDVDGELVAVSYYTANVGAFIWFGTFNELLALPTEKPVPPSRSQRYWFAPCIGSVDYVRLFDDPSVLKDIGAWEMVTETILNLGTDIGGNTFEALQANHAFQKLRQAGIPLAIAGRPFLSDLDTVDKIRAAGGDQTYSSISEPLSWLYADHAVSTLDALVAQVVTFTEAARAKNVKCGWLEGWPSVRVEQYRPYLQKLVDAGANPAYLHLDIDRRHAEQLGLSMSSAILALSALAHEFGIPFGVMVWPYDAKDEATAAADVRRFAQSVHSTLPDLQHVCVQSWAIRLTNHKRELPNCLGPSGHLSVLNETIALFGGVVPFPEPEPEPVPPVELRTMIAYSTPVPGFSQGELVTNPDGTVSVRKPNGKYLCVTPLGDVEERDNPGGPWESFKKGKSTLIAERDGSRVYVLSIAE